MSYLVIKPFHHPITLQSVRHSSCLLLYLQYLTDVSEQTTLKLVPLISVYALRNAKSTNKLV